MADKNTTTKKKAAPKKAAAVGIPKKATKDNKELQAKIGEFISKELDDMMTDFKDLTIAKKWDYLIALLPYATPKMQATDITATADFDPLGTQLGQLANSKLTSE